LEKRHIFATLERCQNNRTRAAKLLDISVRTLRNKLHEYGATLVPEETGDPGENPESPPPVGASVPETLAP